MATIRDVAREAGVSIATVSHVVNGTRFVSPATADRVKGAMDALNYRPQALARRLRRGESSTLGLLISDIANPFFPELVSAFEEDALESGLEVLVGNTRYDPQRCRKSMERFLDAQVRGVAVFASELDPKSLEPFRRYEVPLLLLDRGLTEGASVLEIDYAEGLELAVAHLYDLGHRHIAFVGGPASLYSAGLRRTAFEAAMARRGSEDPRVRTEVIPGDFQVAGGRRAARHLSGMATRPTAVVCANDLMALSLLSQLSTDGISVPAEISVVGFDGIGLGAIAAPPLTTVALDPSRLAKDAFRLIRRIAFDGEDPESMAVIPILIERRSTAPPP